MATNGHIVLVEDDQGDADAICEALKSIGVTNQVRHFLTTHECYDYLCTTTEKAFIILSDIKMPVTDGIALRSKIFHNPYLRTKSIPFIFFTGLATQEMVNAAFEMDVQGFYKKEPSFEELKEQLLTICLYWKKSLHPNKQL